MKIIYNENYLPEKLTDGIFEDDHNIDLIAKDLNPREPQQSLIMGTVLIVLQNITIDVVSGVIVNGICTLVKKLYKSWRESPHPDKMKASMKIEEDGLSVQIILKSGVDKKQYWKIIQLIQCFEIGRYIIILENNGHFKVFTELEYAHHKHDRNKKMTR